MRKLVALCGLLLVILELSTIVRAQNTSGVLVNYPTEPDPILSAKFSVKVNGESVPVYDVGGANKSSYVHFSFAGVAQVEVTVNGGSNGYDLSPRSYEVRATTSGSVINLILDKPRKMLLHTGSFSDEMLAILADPIEDNVPDLNDPGVINVADYGVSTNGEGENSGKIQQALDALPSGGTLYFPPGKYTTGGLQPPSNTNIYLAGGAVLHAVHDYAKISGQGQGLINIRDGVSQVRIYGRGVLDGSAEDLFADDRWDITVRSRGGSSYHTIEGIIIRNSQRFSTMMWGHHTTIRNLKIMQSGVHPNVDGISLIRNDNYLVEDVFVLSGDDSFVNNPTESKDYNGVARNMTLFNKESGRNIFMGYTANGARNFRYENVDLVENYDDINGSIELRVGDGVFSDVHFRNIRVENTGRNLVQLTSFFDLTQFVNEKGSGQLKDITFSEIRQENSGPGTNNVGVYFDNQAGSANTIDVNFSNYYIAGNRVTSLKEGDFEVRPSSNVTFDTRAALPIINVSTETPSISASARGQFTISRTGNTDNPVAVSYTVRGTATNGTDYTTLANTVTIPAGAMSQTITINPTTDNTDEAYKTVLITLDMDWDRYTVGANYLAQLVINGSSVASTPPAATITNGVYELHPASAPDKLLATGGAGNGSNVALATDGNQVSQRWQFTLLKNGYYRLSPLSDTRQCLDVRRRGTSPGTNVQTWRCNPNGQANQEWKITLEDEASGHYRLAPRHTEEQGLRRSLDVAGASRSDGANVQLWTTNGTEAQRFVLEKVGQTNARTAANKSGRADTEDDPASVRVYPNPSPDGTFTITAPLAASTLVVLYDLQGRPVATKSQRIDDQQLEVKPLVKLSKSLYFLHLRRKDGTLTRHKVIVE